jgi:hypothetical protein
VLLHLCGNIVPVITINHSSRDHPNSNIEATIAAEFHLLHARLRSKNPTILPINTEIEWTIRQKPTNSIEEEEVEFKVEETMAEQLVNQQPLVNPPPPTRRPMKQSFIPQNPNQPSCIAYQPEAEGNYNISPQILNALTHFRALLMKIHTCTFD